MRTCKDVSRLISQAQDSEIGFADRFALHLHLAMCDSCAKFRKQLSFLRDAARRFPGPGEGDKV